VRRITIRSALWLAALVLAPTWVATPASAKLPPGTTFEVCGASGCKTVAAEDVLAHRVIEPTFEHGDVGPPTRALPWTQVDIEFSVGRDDGWTPRALRPLERGFPAIFVPQAETVGIPTSAGTFRWVSMSSVASGVYARLVAATEPFSAQSLSILNPYTASRAVADAIAARASGSEGDRGELHPVLIVVPLALGALLVWRMRRTAPASA